jgi:large subunit ribosomal protein L3
MRMAGHMGNVRCTVQNLEVVQVREADNLILVKGAVPGPNGGIVVIRKAVKKKGVKKS